MMGFIDVVVKVIITGAIGLVCFFGYFKLEKFLRGGLGLNIIDYGFSDFEFGEERDNGNAFFYSGSFCDCGSDCDCSGDCDCD